MGSMLTTMSYSVCYKNSVLVGSLFCRYFLPLSRKVYRGVGCSFYCQHATLKYTNVMRFHYQWYACTVEKIFYQTIQNQKAKQNQDEQPNRAKRRGEGGEFFIPSKNGLSNNARWIDLHQISHYTYRRSFLRSLRNSAMGPYTNT